MNPYRDDDARNTSGVWDVLNAILSSIQEIQYLIDQKFCELDDGCHWVKTPIEGEEE